VPDSQGPQHHGAAAEANARAVRRVLRQAWELNDANKAEKLIRNLARRLEHDAPGVSASIREGLDEILTVTRLGLPKELRRALACPWDEVPRYLIRDRDGVYGVAVTRRLRAMGIRDKPIAAGSPWQNSFAERLIGTIRRECVDHIVVLGEPHLRRTLREYARYYNTARTHRSLDQDAPVSRPVQQIGRIVSHALVGGLHHQYVRI
jgi:hypothetical protein